MQTGKININSQNQHLQFTIDLMPDRTGIRIWGSRMAFLDFHQGIWDCIGDSGFEEHCDVADLGME
jgi:hypothetical protein